MKTYQVGRSHKNDIVIPETEKTVSGIHLEMTQDDKGNYYIVDRKSTNGTYRKHKDHWLRIQHAYVEPDEPLLLGRYEITIRQLLTRYGNQPASDKSNSQPESHNSPVERDPETGEIIKSI